MTTLAPEDTWVSIAEAAEQLDVHPRTLRRYIKDGKLTVLRLSAQIVRIRPEDVEKFRKENIKVVTGTGTSYVTRTESVRSVPTGTVHHNPSPAPPARFSH